MQGIFHLWQNFPDVDYRTLLIIEPHTVLAVGAREGAKNAQKILKTWRSWRLGGENPNARFPGRPVRLPDKSCAPRPSSRLWRSQIAE